MTLGPAVVASAVRAPPNCNRITDCQSTGDGVRFRDSHWQMTALKPATVRVLGASSQD
jgi:hypothetical protein